MAITYSEDGKKKVRKGDKKAIAMGKEFFGAVANRFAALQHFASSGRNGMDRDCAFFEGVHEGRVVQGVAGDHA